MAEFEEEIDEISDAEKLQIAQHFLLSSPPGQFAEVSADVHKLLPGEILTPSLETGIARVYNNKNCRVVKAPSGATVALSSHGEVDATHYVDPTNGSVFAVNHISAETTDDHVESTQDTSVELKRTAIQSEITKYIDAQFAESLSAGSVYAKDSKIYITITGERANLRNFWSGKWNSNWVVEFNGGKASLSGDVKLHAHYFEDGNIQMQSAQPIESQDIAFNSEQELGEKISKSISESEQKLQTSLGLMYLNMNEETLKSVRRVLPISKVKMEWNLNAVKLNSSLNAKK